MCLLFLRVSFHSFSPLFWYRPRTCSSLAALEPILATSCATCILLSLENIKYYTCTIPFYGIFNLLGTGDNQNLSSCRSQRSGLSPNEISFVISPRFTDTDYSPFFSNHGVVICAQSISPSARQGYIIPRSSVF